MIVCVCKRVSESQILSEINAGACRLSDLSERLGVGTQCGCCRDYACSLLQQQLHNPAGNVQIQNATASLAA